MLEIRNLNKCYGSHRALKDLNLTVADGELFGFVGANGAGKTTTMKICVGLLKADSGEVFIDGEKVSLGGEALRMKVGYVPDFFGTYDNLTAIEYLKFFAGAYDIWGEEAESLCTGLLELVNLSDKRDSEVDGLSRGMKQRLCLARALVHNPGILFLDEPASGLDPKARHELKEILKNLSSMGKTIIISSHILPELIEMCSSIGIINHGSMMFNGTIDEALTLQRGEVSYEILVLSDKDEAVMHILELPFVKNVKREDEKIIVFTTGDDKDNSSMLKKLVMEGVEVLSFKKNTEGVEDIFLNIMEGEQTDAN